MLEPKEGTLVTFKWAKEMVTRPRREVVMLLTRSCHIISVLVGLVIYQEIVARKGGVTHRAPGVPAFWQPKNWLPKICAEHSLLMGHPPCTLLTTRY
jgi:hypothetical protein